MRIKAVISAVLICCMCAITLVSCGDNDLGNITSISSPPESVPLSSSVPPSSSIPESSSSVSEESSQASEQSSQVSEEPVQKTPEELAAELMNLINLTRSNYGLAPYITDNAALNAAAWVRAAEIAKSYSHTRPDGTPCSTAYPPYLAAGENTAKEYNTVQNVYTYWMASPSNRGNITDEYKYGYDAAAVGVHISEDGTYYWVFCVIKVMTEIPVTPSEAASATEPSA